MQVRRRIDTLVCAPHVMMIVVHGPTELTLIFDLYISHMNFFISLCGKHTTNQKQSLM